MSTSNFFEIVLIKICKIFFGAVWLATVIHETIVKIFSVILIFVLAITAIFAIDLLPAYWESLVLQAIIIGSSVSFVSILVLRFWKAEKFAAIYSQQFEKCSKTKT